MVLNNYSEKIVASVGHLNDKVCPRETRVPKDESAENVPKSP